MTMNLLDLPPELIGRILELSTAPDFENLSKQLLRATLHLVSFSGRLYVCIYGDMHSSLNRIAQKKK